MYTINDQQSVCESVCGWTIKWQFDLETFVKDGESLGLGRFVGLDKETNKIACQLWFIDSGFKVELGEGYSVQVDPEKKNIMILKKP